MKLIKQAIPLGALLLALIASLLSIGQAQAADDDIYKEVKWEMLVPKGWKPVLPLKTTDLSEFDDSDPKAMKALQAMKTIWDNAPAEPSMNGRDIRIPGFMIPLDKTGDAVKSFLLVPYFGACIHSPPPPSNQMIQVFLDKPLQGFHTMDGVWVYGALAVTRIESPWGKTAYVLKTVKVKPYKW